jgi:hypothetical protein
MTTTTGGRIIHVSEMRRFPDCVYIGGRNSRYGLAQSPFHNPFRVTERTEDVSRHMACLAYRDYLRSSIEGRKVLALLPTLRGKDLACWCRTSDATGTAWQECHGDQILRLLRDHTDAELIAMSRAID